jgi:hypothetical protein
MQNSADLGDPTKTPSVRFISGTPLYPAPTIYEDARRILAVSNAEGRENTLKSLALRCAAHEPAAQGKGLLLFSRHLFLSAQARLRKRTGLLSARPWRDSEPPLQTNETAERKRMFPGPWVVKMSLFALDFEIEMPYPLAPPQGWEVDFDL